MFLLAQFRESRAYPLFVRIASLPSDVLDELFAETITESFGRFLASVCGGDIGAIQSLIENENADEYVRGAALTSLVTLVAVEQKSREEIVSYFARLFQGLLAPQPSNVWNELVACSADLYPDELIDDIEHAYEQDLVDPGFVGLWEIKRDILRGKNNVLAKLAENPHRQLVEDTAQEMEWWACFREDQPSREWTPPPAAPPVQLHRPGPKIGRNDPCPCGSGKKYKKCCGA